MKVISVLKRSLEIKSPVKLSLILLFLIALSCQKDEFDRNTLTGEIAPVSAMGLSDAGLITYYNEETFTITTKEAVVETRVLGNPDYFDKLFIKVQNGNSGNTKVTKMEILIDNVPVVTFADFRKNLNTMQKEVSGIKEGSILKVKIDGSKGRFIKVKIEGILKGTSIIDVDGNLYHSVMIGDQCWMTENLKTTKYKDGTPIPQFLGGDLLDGYSWYALDPGNKDTYGALYTMGTVKSGNLCPDGWHVPDNNEWGYLTDVLGGPSEAGGKLKETGTTHWAAPNTGATNESGFTALPGGYLDHWNYIGLGQQAIFWSTSKCGGTSDCGWSVIADGIGISWSDRNPSVGYSVRCVCGPEPLRPEVQTSPLMTYINSTEAYQGVYVADDHGLPVTQQGVCWSTDPLPTISESHTSNGIGLMTGLTPATEYYVRAYATNSAGTGYSMSITFTTKASAEAFKADVEGNVYETVQIGSQEWMTRNLQSTMLNDGLPIQLITTDDLAWWNSVTPAYCVHPHNELVWHGATYNWQSVNSGKLCPQGWHVPADADWTVLTNYLIANGYNYDETLEGNKIAKALSAWPHYGWKASATPGTPGNSDYPDKINASGFLARPAGTRGLVFSPVYNEIAVFWSSTPSHYTGNYYTISYNGISGFLTGPDSGDKQTGWAVRCLKTD
jgi:uncharacterized protein (TIGR02145 family)